MIPAVYAAYFIVNNINSNFRGSGGGFPSDPKKPKKKFRKYLLIPLTIMVIFIGGIIWILH